MPLPLWALMAGASAIKAGVSHFSGQQQANRMNKYATDLSKVTPNERDYIKRQEDIAKGGDPFQNQLMQQQMNLTMGNIRQTGAENLQRAEGSIIGQGLETSIVASEIRRKVNKDTLRNIGEQSRRITAENRVAQEQTKRQAEDRRYQAQQGVDARGRQAMGMKAQIPSRGERNMQLLGSLAQTGLSAYQGWQQPTYDEQAFKTELDQYGRKLDVQVDKMGTGALESWMPAGTESPGYKQGQFWIPGVGYVPTGSEAHRKYQGQ